MLPPTTEKFQVLTTCAVKTSISRLIHKTSTCRRSRLLCTADAMMGIGYSHTKYSHTNFIRIVHFGLILYNKTRSSAIAQGPRDAPCQLKSCRLHNCTKNRILKGHVIGEWPWVHRKYRHSIRISSLPFNDLEQQRRYFAPFPRSTFAE